MPEAFMSMDEDIRDRLRGVAVGAAIGDALGMPLEFGPAIPPDQLVRTMQPGRLPAGAFTDDTEMALALADSLLDTARWTCRSLAAPFRRLVSRRAGDIGIQTSNVLGQAHLGGDLGRQPSTPSNAENPWSAGNGSVMRCWPVALAHWDDLDSPAGRQPPAEPGDASTPRMRRGQRVRQRDHLPPGTWR